MRARALTFSAALLASSTALASVTLDASSTVNVFSGVSTMTTNAATAVAATAAVVAFNFNGTGQTAVACHLDASTTMTNIGQYTTTRPGYMFAYVGSIAAGSHTATCSWSSSSASGEAQLATFAGTDTSSVANAFSTYNTSNGSASPGSITITNASGNLALALYTGYTSNANSVSGTQIGRANNITAYAWQYSLSVNPTLTVTLSGADTWDMIGVSVMAPAAASPTCLLPLLGVGC